MGLKLKRGTTANKPTLADGEVYIDITKKALTMKADGEEFDAGAMKVYDIDNPLTLTETVVYRFNSSIDQLEGFVSDPIFEKQMIILDADYKLYKWIGTDNPAYDIGDFSKNYEEINSGSDSEDLEYIAIWTQTGENAPVVTVWKDTIGVGSPSRQMAGEYLASFQTADLNFYCPIVMPDNISVNIGADGITVSTVDEAEEPADGILSNTLIHFRLFPV